MLIKRILIVEDDVYIGHMVRDLLSRAGFQVSTARNGTGAMQRLFNERPDLVILDVNLDDGKGWCTFQQMRTVTETPVIILGASSDRGARARAISMGAAEFIGKPFRARSLLSQTKDVLGRRDLVENGLAGTDYEDGYLSIDMESNRVFVRGKRVQLTKTELRILKYLLANASLLVTFEEILAEVWGPGYEDNIDYIHVYISRLRRKIEERPRRPRYIISEHGLGYRFAVLSK